MSQYWVSCVRKHFLEMGYQVWKLRRKMWEKISEFVTHKQYSFLVVPDKYKECQPPVIPFDFS